MKLDESEKVTGDAWQRDAQRHMTIWAFPRLSKHHGCRAVACIMAQVFNSGAGGLPMPRMLCTVLDRSSQKNVRLLSVQGWTGSRNHERRSSSPSAMPSPLGGFCSPCHLPFFLFPSCLYRFLALRVSSRSCVEGQQLCAKKIGEHRFAKRGKACSRVHDISIFGIKICHQRNSEYVQDRNRLVSFSTFVSPICDDPQLTFRCLARRKPLDATVVSSVACRHEPVFLLQRGFLFNILMSNAAAHAIVGEVAGRCHPLLALLVLKSAWITKG
jgi:hypothetical protein